MLIVIVIFTVLLNAVFNNADTKMTYSELLTSVTEEKVKKIELSADGDMAYVTLIEESTTPKEVTIPSLESFMDAINDKMISGSIKVTQEEESIFMALLETQLCAKIEQ